MDYVESLFNAHFLEYASYTIRDRAIPDAENRLKPIQCRILHLLFKIDGGKFHKIANVTGYCMKYHLLGDAFISNALVLLANKSRFIEKQGNFGNLYTEDNTSASRYIECRITPCAKKTTETIIQAFIKGFALLLSELIQTITEDDTERLLKIPIRYIFLYDKEQNRIEPATITVRLTKIEKHLKNIKKYALSILDTIVSKLEPEKTARKTLISSFTQTDAKKRLAGVYRCAMMRRKRSKNTGHTAFRTQSMCCQMRLSSSTQFL